MKLTDILTMDAITFRETFLSSDVRAEAYDDLKEFMRETGKKGIAESAFEEAIGSMDPEEYVSLLLFTIEKCYPDIREGINNALVNREHTHVFNMWVVCEKARISQDGMTKYLSVMVDQTFKMFEEMDKEKLFKYLFTSNSPKPYISNGSGGECLLLDLYEREVYASKDTMPLILELRQAAKNLVLKELREEMLQEDGEVNQKLIEEVEEDLDNQLAELEEDDTRMVYFGTSKYRASKKLAAALSNAGEVLRKASSDSSDSLDRIMDEISGKSDDEDSKKVH